MFPGDRKAFNQAIKRLKLIDSLLVEFCRPGEMIPFKKKLGA